MGEQSEMIHRSYGFSVRAMAEEGRSVDVVASSEDIDSWGEIVVQDWDLSRYEKNPVVLYGHNSWGLPIGHASNVRVEKNQLLATLKFVDARANPLAEQVWQGIVQGSLRAVSVGFRCKQAKSQVVGDRTVFVLSGNELLEISVVPIPANPEAVAVATKSMNIIRALAGAQPQQEQPMSLNVKTLLAILSLAETATEADAIEKVKSLEKRATDAEARVSVAETKAAACAADTAKLLEAVGSDTVEKALGAIAAGKAAVGELAVEKAKGEQLERAQLIADAKAAKKLTPAQEKGLEGKSLEFVKGFLDLQVPNPTLQAEDAKQPETKSSDLSWNGKTWDQLKPQEKHDLFHENKDLYVAMRDAAAKSAA